MILKSSSTDSKKSLHESSYSPQKRPVPLKLGLFQYAECWIFLKVHKMLQIGYPVWHKVLILISKPWIVCYWVVMMPPPENLKFGEVPPIQPTETSGSRKGLFIHPVSTQVQNTAQKSCNISCNKKTLTPENQYVKVLLSCPTRTRTLTDGTKIRCPAN